MSLLLRLHATVHRHAHRQNDTHRVNTLSLLFIAFTWRR